MAESCNEIVGSSAAGGIFSLNMIHGLVEPSPSQDAKVAGPSRPRHDPQWRSTQAPLALGAETAPLPLRLNRLFHF